jgi:hypothetical protein
MKIKDNSIINIVTNNSFKKFNTDYFVNGIKFFETITTLKESTRMFRLEILKIKKEFNEETNFRRLVFSDKSYNNLKNYQVPTKIRTDVLRSLPNRKDVVQLNKDECFKYIKTDECIKIWFSYYDYSDGTYYSIFIYVDFVQNVYWFDRMNPKTKERMNYDEMIETYYSKFMVAVTYLELTPITLNVVKGGGTFGKNRLVKVKNDTKKDFILVNTNWNIEYHLEDINVRGHWRLQPYGSGRSKYKYIYINPFVRSYTKKTPQKELV